MDSCQDMIDDLVDIGVGVYQIAEKIGKSKATIYNMRNGTNNNPTQDTINKLTELHKKVLKKSAVRRKGYQ